MTYYFAIHGVPQGSQQWGDIQDRDYISSFYNSVSAQNVPTQMIVDIRYLGNKICTYYHYLVYNNVLAANARPGSYFGMTLCFEGSYSEAVSNIYDLMNQCFNKVVCSRLLEASNQSYKYAIADFSSQEGSAILSMIDAAIRKNVGVFSDSLRPFPQNYKPNHRDDNYIDSWNLNDVGNRTFISTLLEDAIISISPSYPVMQDKVKLFRRQNAQHKATIDSLTEENQSMRGGIANLNKTVEEQNNIINKQAHSIEARDKRIAQQGEEIRTAKTQTAQVMAQLNQEKQMVQTLQTELAQLRSSDDNEKLDKCFNVLQDIAVRRNRADVLLNKTKNELSATLSRISGIEKQLNGGRKPINLKWVACVVIALVVVVCICLLFVENGSDENKYDNSSIQTQIQELKLKVDDLESKLESHLVDCENVSTQHSRSESVSAEWKEIEQGVESSDSQSDAQDCDWIDIIVSEGVTTTPKSATNSTIVGITWVNDCTITLTAQKEKGDDGEKLEYGGGNFYYKVDDEADKIIQSDDNGKTAIWTVPEDLQGKSVTLVYKYGDVEKAPRTITIN